jgi:predicted nucleic acid-binding protein
MKIVVDTNILFSALLSCDNIHKVILLSGAFDFYSCNYLMTEIFKHKNRIVKHSSLSEHEIVEQFEMLLRRINFVPEEMIPSLFYKQATDLCIDIDHYDIPFVALSLYLDGYLLTGDKDLLKYLASKNFKVFSVHDIRNIIKNLIPPNNF